MTRSNGEYLTVPLNDTVNEVRKLLSEKLAIDVDSPDADLLGTGLLDSLGLIQLLVHLEEKFGVQISLAEIEIEDLRSVSSIAALVVRQLVVPEQPAYSEK
jgi:methoxymalonate biosynthesis acyl carrier protein